VADYGSLVRRLEKAVADTPGRCVYRHWLGAVLYRAGKYPDAIRPLKEADQFHPKPGWPSDWLFLAMAHQRQGQLEQARSWLDKAVKAIDRLAKEKPSDEPFGWIYLVELRLLRREAEALLRVSGRAP
jgi:tetratricopeptide (TPR) repeat protein